MPELSRLAVRQGLPLPATVSHYLMQRYTRDTHKLVALMQHLNQASLSARRPLTVPFVRNQLTLLQEPILYDNPTRPTQRL